MDKIVYTKLVSIKKVKHIIKYGVMNDDGWILI